MNCEILAVSVKVGVKDELVNAPGCERYELIVVFVNSDKYERRTLLYLDSVTEGFWSNCI